MNDLRLTFLDGLFWYLETRTWAFEKIKSCPTGSQALDIKMYHYLYFSNLFGAVDIVRDYSREIGERVEMGIPLTQVAPTDCGLTLPGVG